MFLVPKESAEAGGGEPAEGEGGEEAEQTPEEQAQSAAVAALIAGSTISLVKFSGSVSPWNIVVVLEGPF